jgi:hypothetical protein
MEYKYLHIGIDCKFSCVELKRRKNRSKASMKMGINERNEESQLIILLMKNPISVRSIRVTLEMIRNHLNMETLVVVR